MKTITLPGITAAAILVVSALLLAGCDDQGAAASASATPAAGSGSESGAVTPVVAEAPDTDSKPTGTYVPPRIETAGPTAPAVAATPAGGISTGDAASGARISFPKEKHDFGIISDTETHRTSFEFTNTGSGTLVISDVKAACGCTVPTLRKRQFAPGESGEIEIVFDPKGKQGPTDKQITVISNVKPEGVTELWLTSNIKPLVEFERMFRLGTLKRGQEHRNIINLYYTDPDLALSNIRVNNPNLSVRLLGKGFVASTSAEEVKYRAELELIVHADAPWGVIFATRVSMDAYGRPSPEKNPVNYAYDIYVIGEVFGELTGRPSIVSLGPLSRGSSFEKSTLITRPTGVPFSLTEVTVVESTMPGITTRIEQRSPAAYAVFVSGNPGAFVGAIKGRLKIKTDVPGEEELEVRFSGSVR